MVPLYLKYDDIPHRTRYVTRNRVRATGKWTGAREIGVGWNGQYPALERLQERKQNTARRKRWTDIFVLLAYRLQVPCATPVSDSPIYNQSFVLSECIMSSSFCGLRSKEQLPEATFSNSSKSIPRNPIYVCCISYCVHTQSGRTTKCHFSNRF
jgi:hypothetical protein